MLPADDGRIRQRADLPGLGARVDAGSVGVVDARRLRPRRQDGSLSRDEPQSRRRARDDGDAHLQLHRTRPEHRRQGLPRPSLGSRGRSPRPLHGHVVQPGRPPEGPALPRRDTSQQRQPSGRDDEHVGDGQSVPGRVAREAGPDRGRDVRRHRIVVPDRAPELRVRRLRQSDAPLSLGRRRPERRRDRRAHGLGRGSGHLDPPAEALRALRRRRRDATRALACLRRARLGRARLARPADARREPPRRRPGKRGQPRRHVGLRRLRQPHRDHRSPRLHDDHHL